MTKAETGFPEPILHVDMDAFFVEVERRRRPELRGRPVVVGGAGPRGVVASASYEARAFGIRSAMPMSRAVRRCPGLVVVAPDHAAYRRASEEVFEVFRSYTPLVEGLSLDEAFLDVAGLRLHHPDPDSVAAALRASLREATRLTASVGIASTKFVAKLASADAKPDGVLRVPVADVEAYLAPKSVRSLWGVGEATHAALERLGVSTIGELASVSESALARALGSSLGSHLARIARGLDQRAVTPESSAKSVSVEHTYDTDLVGVDEIEAALLGHCDKVGYRLRRAGLRGRTVTLKVRFADFTTVTRSHTRASATTISRELFRDVLDLLGRIDLRQPVRLLGVGVSSLEDADAPRQLEVGSGDHWERVTEAVDEVRRRFGSGAVRPARLVDRRPSNPATS